MGLYAADTSVSSDKSKAEIEATLRRYGADQFMAGWKDEQAVVQFRIKEKLVRFILPLPSTEEFRIEVKWKKEREAAPEVVQRNWEQACRQRWRALALAIKAKLEAVACGITSFEEEFMAHIIIPGTHGKTVGDMILKNLEDSYASGKPMQLEWGGK